MTATQAALTEVLDRLRQSPARLGGTQRRLLCIDGPAGSGKTTLAEQIADRTGAGIVHMDDLYAGWSGLPGVADRVREQILDPIARGEVARYQRYDWARAQFAEWVDVPQTEVLVLEGCGSGSQVVADHLGLLVWVSAPDEVRLARGLARDGQAMAGRWRDFMAGEAAVYAAERTPQRAHLHLNAWGKIVARR